MGRATSDRTRIASAALVLLESLSVRHGGYLESLDFYQGELGDDASIDQVMNQLAGRCPAVLVMVGGSKYEPKSITKRRYLIDYSLEIACISQHWESNEGRAHGGNDKFTQGADPGVDAILDDTRRLLIGRDLNIEGTGAPVPMGESVVFQGREMAIFQATYSVRIAFEQSKSSDSKHVATSSHVGTTLKVEGEQ
jgi:hypothetical protein